MGYYSEDDSFGRVETILQRASVLGAIAEDDRAELLLQAQKRLLTLHGAKEKEEFITLFTNKVITGMRDGLKTAFTGFFAKD